MEFKIIEETPVSKHIEVTILTEEVNAAIAGAVELNRGSVQMDGFRKGKVPANVIEKRFHDQIYNEAKENLINVNLNEILQKLDVEPVGGIVLKGDDHSLEKGKEYSYTIKFENLPKFDLPNYEGLEVEQEKVVIKDDELEQVFERFLEDHASLVPVEGNAPAKDGQIANLDFEAFDGNEPLKEFQTQNFDFELGANSALPDFEAIVKGIPAGNTGEGTVHFPEDFFVKKLAGRDILLKVKVNRVKEKRLPKLNDAFAESLGMKNAEQLKELLTKSYKYSAEKLNRSAAEQKLLDQLLKQVDFDLPPEMVKTQANLIIGDMADKLERMGKSLADSGKKYEELMEEVKPQAEIFTRSRILLNAIAKKEKLEVTPEEVRQAVYEQALRSGDDFKEMMDKMDRTGMLFQLQDHLLSDKGMDAVYTKAKVTMVDPREEEETDEGIEDASLSSTAEKEQSGEAAKD